VNTANLQLEELLMAMAEINRLLVARGLLTSSEIEDALRRAEAGLGGERFNELSPANRDAIAFPIRILQLASQANTDGVAPDFSGLAKKVGETKKPYNDQQ